MPCSAGLEIRERGEVASKDDVGNGDKICHFEVGAEVKECAQGCGEPAPVQHLYVAGT